MIQKKLLAAVCGSAALLLAGCNGQGGLYQNDGNMYRADVYNANSVNRVQEVNTVTIVAVNPAQVAVDNSDNRRTATTVGAVLGGIAGVAIGNHDHHSTSSRVLGGVGGAALGGLAGSAIAGNSSTAYANGVQIVYRAPDGKTYQSAQVGRICEYKLGEATVVSSESGETRIQPNNPGGCGQSR
jgi:outer membrane lipoprotein SlyB